MLVLRTLEFERALRRPLLRDHHQPPASLRIDVLMIDDMENVAVPFDDAEHIEVNGDLDGQSALGRVKSVFIEPSLSTCRIWTSTVLR